VRLSEGKLAGHDLQASQHLPNTRVVEWIYLKEASGKRVLDGSEMAKENLTQARTGDV